MSKLADISFGDRRPHRHGRRAYSGVFTACPWSWCRL